MLIYGRPDLVVTKFKSYNLANSCSIFLIFLFIFFFSKAFNYNFRVFFGYSTTINMFFKVLRQSKKVTQPGQICSGCQKHWGKMSQLFVN